MNLIIEKLKPEDSRPFLSTVKKVLSDVQQLLEQEPSKDESLSVLSALVTFYLKCPSKFQIKRLIASFFQNLCRQYQDVIEKEICSQLLFSVPTDYAETKDVNNIRHSVDNINFLLENFMFGERCLAVVSQESLHFLVQAEEYFWSHVGKDVPPVYLNEVMHHCLVTMQTMNLVLQKLVVDKAEMTREFTANVDLMRRLTCIDVEMIQNELLLLDCRCCCAMNVFLLIQISLPDDEAVDLIPSLLYPNDGKEGELQVPSLSWLSEKIDYLDINKQSSLSFLVITFGYIAMVTPEKFMQEANHGKFFYIDKLLPSLLKHGEKCEDTVSKALFGKTVNLWTTRLVTAVVSHESLGSSLASRLREDSLTITSLLQYVWTHWEDQLDIMRQSAKTVFENVLKMNMSSTTRGSTESSFISSLLSKLFKVSWTSRGKFSALSSCVLLVGANCLLKQRENFPTEILSQFQDRSMACYACELYMNTLVAHRKELSTTSAAGGESKQKGGKLTVMTQRNEEVFLKMWILPVIDELRFSKKIKKNNIVEYLLPRLLKSDKKFLDHMIHELSVPIDQGTNTGPSCGAIVACLRRARTMGFLKASPLFKGGKELWYGVLHPDILKKTLFAQDEQVRLDAFAFLCETNKSTEAFTSAEFEMLRLFIPSNLNSQSPAFRQSLLALLKKLFTRVKESLPPLKRMAIRNNEDATEGVLYYTAFLEWVTSLLLTNLHPGAAFARRTTCLSTLSLMDSLFTKEDDGFSVSSYLGSFHIQTLLKCLADTFEENNVESLNILTSYTKLTGHVATQARMHSLFQMSLSLACSTRPQDCGTAAYVMLLLRNQRDVFSLIKSHQMELKTNTAKEMLSMINSMFASSHPVPDKSEDHNQAYATIYLLHILVVFLHDQSEVAKQSLITAASNRPMYPTLQCIRYIMQEVKWKSFPPSLMSLGRHFIQLLIQTCLNLSTVVSPVVQNASPEGNVPADAILGPGLNIAELLPQSDYDAALNPSPSDTSSQNLSQSIQYSQMLVEAIPEYLVVCCWRCIKEVSLTLGKMCLQIPVSAIVEETISQEDDTAILSLHIVKTVGDYFIHQLLGSVHRGAFELAYVGFQLMCQMLWQHPHPAFHSLPAQWLQQVIADIKCEDSNSKLCATRRSAGVPFFIQAITSSEPFLTGRQCFHSAMKELIVFALDECGDSGGMPVARENKDARVHALNILRALYKDARLREDVVPYIADGVKAAIRGFKSNLWSVRNSATLLMSTLMTRMFGVKRSKDESVISKKNCQTGRSFFYHYPSLYPFLLAQLEEATQCIGPSNSIRLHPSLYPVLLVLGRLFPSMLEGSDTSLSLSAFIPYVLKCASSPILKTRIIAARALQPLAKRNQVVDIAKQLFINIPLSNSPGAPASSSSSHIHGSLLQLCELVKLVREFNAALQQSILHFLVSEMLLRSWLWSEGNRCFTTRQASLQLVDYILDVAKFLGSLNETEGELVRKLKTNFITSLSFATGPEDRWKPLVYEYEKIRAVLSLKHLDALEEFDTKLTSEPNSNFKESVVISFLQSSFYEVRLQVSYMFVSALDGDSHPEGESGGDHQDKDTSANTNTGELAEAGGDSSGHTMTENVYSSHDATTRDLMRTMAVDMFDHILHLALDVEEHHECLQKVFHILALVPKCDELLKAKEKSVINKLFKTMLAKIKDERRNEVKAAMLRFTGHFIPVLYDSIQSEAACEQHELLSQWTSLVCECCWVEEYPDLMVSVAHVLLDNTRILLCDMDHRIGLLSLPFWNVLSTLLQEDDLEVQDLAASVLAVASGLDQGSLHPNVALEKLPESLLSAHQDKPLCDLTKFLVSWIVQDAAVDVKEPNERLFDRSEANAYKDYIAFTRCVVKALNGLFHHQATTDSEPVGGGGGGGHTGTEFIKELQDSDLIAFLVQSFDKLEHELNVLRDHCQSTDAFLNPLRHVSLWHGVFRASNLVSVFKDVYRNENTIQLKISGLHAKVSDLMKEMDVCDLYLV